MAISRTGVMSPHSRLSSLSAVRTRSRMADCTAGVRAQMPPAAGLFTVRPDPPTCAAWPSAAAPPSDTAHDTAAVQRQAVRCEIDAVGVQVRRLHGVAEGQRPRARTAQVAGSLRPRADGERDRRRAAGHVHGHGAVEAQVDLDRLARCVGGSAGRCEGRLDRLRPRRYPHRDIGGGGNVDLAGDRESERMGPILARHRRREGRARGGARPSASRRRPPSGTRSM